MAVYRINPFWRRKDFEVFPTLDEAFEAAADEVCRHDTIIEVWCLSNACWISMGIVTPSGLRNKNTFYHMRKKREAMRNEAI